MPDPNDVRLVRSVQKKTNSLLNKRAKLNRAVAEHTAAIADLDQRALAFEAAGDHAKAKSTRADIAKTRSARDRARARVSAVDAGMLGLLGGIGRVDTCDADPSVPLVLLPVRIETRYTANKKTLRVRIFPDVIHVDALDRGMSAEEVKAGTVFWGAARAGGAALDDAWDALVEAVGRRRASWVALGLTPENREDWLQGAAPQFPSPGPRTRAAAVARLLPDRFVVVAQQGKQRSTATTSTVAHEVVAGLLSEDGSNLVDMGGIRVPEGGEWMVAYDAAVKAGLAVDLDLAKAGAVDRLFVVGVRRSLDAKRAAVELASLFEGHRCTRGLAFVPQGSPSNNTETDRSEWSVAPEPQPPAHALETAAAVDPQGNGPVLAQALGIDPSALDGIDYAEVQEQALARAMNASLWPASWGAFIDRLTDPDPTDANAAVSDATEQAVRSFFRDFVRGRGPLPTLRVGDQPYGFLPVAPSSPSRWKINTRDRIETHLLPLLRNIRTWWENGTTGIPRVGSGADVSDTLLEIMGMHAVSPALRARNIVSEDAKVAAEDVGLRDITTWRFEVDLNSILLRVVGIDPDTLHGLGSLSQKSKPVPYPLAHTSDPDYMDGLLKGSPPKVQSVLQAMLGLALASAERDVASAAPKGMIHDMVKRASFSATAQTRVLAVAGQVQLGSVQIHQETDSLMRSTRKAETGRLTLKQYQPVSHARTSFADLAAESTVSASQAELSTLGTLAWLRARAREAEVREGIEALKDTDLRQRAILIGELLDLSSHRLDAWLTGVVEKRRATLRRKKKSGLTIGAFGWVENLKPGAGANPDGGYIHAPSLDHAATAGILRSAYLTHNADQDGDGAYAVDLSSERVRTALHLIDGIRQGQPLGALLGYRIERDLHDARLDRLILTLRGLAPLVAQRLTDRGEAVPAPASESIAANNVVDGLRLIERFNKSAQEKEVIRQALIAPPTDNPYIDASQWPALTNADWNNVQRIIGDAAEANDAAADLLLAESVFQLVRGNTARAGATLTAAGSGEVPPPEPEVVKTPAPGMPFAHRVMMAVDSTTPSWSPGRPRAVAEPVMERWASERLGDPAKVLVAPDSGGQMLTLADTGLSALDVIYEAGTAGTLEQRVRAALPQLDVDTPLFSLRQAGWASDQSAFGELAELAGALRDVLSTATPAAPGDFSRASDKAVRTVSAAALADVSARATTARGLLASALATLRAAIAPPGGANPDATQLQMALEGLAAFGAVPPQVAGENLLAIAEVSAAEADRRLANADELLGLPALDREDAAAVGSALFGDGFWMLPAVDPAPAGDLFSATWGVVSAPPAEVRRFVRDVGSVRDPMRRFSRLLLMQDAFDRPAALGIAQLAAGTYPWVGGVLGTDFPTPEEPVTNVVVHAPAGWDATTPTHALVVDQWTDVVPIRTPFGGETAGEVPSIEDRRTSGLAVNAASASARAPQAVLMAVSTDGERWTTDRVVEVLEETLALSRLRAISLETAPGAGRILPALHLPAWSIGSEPVFDFRYAAENPHLAAALTYVRESS